jgi:hypothetical protein
MSNNKNIGDSPAGNGGQELLLTAAASGATNRQLVLAAAYNEQTKLHSRRESQTGKQQINKI